MTNNVNVGIYKAVTNGEFRAKAVHKHEFESASAIFRLLNITFFSIYIHNFIHILKDSLEKISNLLFLKF